MIDTEYCKLVKKILNEGEWSENRTGVKTIGVVSHELKHDMSCGFPLLTTKKMAWKSVRVELEGFIKGITDKTWYQERGCKFWDWWANPQVVPYAHDENTKQKMLECKDLGKIYGFQYRNFGDYTYDLRKVAPQKPSEESLSYRPEYNLVRDSVHKILAPQGHDDQGRPLVVVQLSSGFKKILRKDFAEKSKISDPYQLTVCDVGYLGERTSENTEMYKSLYKTWTHMLERCYKKTCKEYKYYGAKGVSVCSRWLNFSNFYQDVQQLVGFAYKRRDLNKYVLDKDHFSSNIYSPETCVWLPRSMNSIYANLCFFEAKSPEGEKFYHISINKFAEQYNLNSKCIYKCLTGERQHHKQWKFIKVEDKGYRFSLPVDQLSWAINEIKVNPSNRRIIVNAWNPACLHEMALPPCHYSYQFLVKGNKLNLIWLQRSVDVPIGLPANIAFYALLLTMVAKECELQPGMLVGQFGDVHIYENQIEGIKEQITREPFKLPEVTLPDFDSIFNWTHDKVEIEGYKSHPKISFPIAV